MKASSTSIALPLAVVMALAAAHAMAKLPPPSEEAKAKAAEAAAKSAWGDKVAAYKLCEVQNQVAAGYLEKARAAGKTVQPTSTPACTDPGSFESKPLEAAGAHSPPQTAATPPSTTQPAGEAKKP